MEIKIPEIEASKISLSNEDVDNLCPENVSTDHSVRYRVGKMFDEISAYGSYNIQGLICIIETNIARIEKANSFLEANKEFLSKLQGIQEKEVDSQVERMHSFNDENLAEGHTIEETVEVDVGASKIEVKA